MNIDLADLDHQTFEDLCNDLLRREIGGVTSIEGAGGDQGVDGFKGEIDDEVVIYQHKFYPDRLTSSRKSKIKNSFDTALEDHPQIEKWMLLIATEFTHKEQEWFEQEIKQTADIDVGYWNKKEIEDRLSTYSNLIQRYFPHSMLAMGRKQQEAVNYLSGTPLERTWLMQQRLNEIREENPHLGIDYDFSSANNTHNVNIEPESPISINTKFKAEEEKLKRVQSGDEVRFTDDEIVNIEFDPESLIGEEIEPTEVVLKPWHSEWEQEVQIEVPNGSFRKELTFIIEDVSENSIIFAAKDPIFNLSIEYGMKNEGTNFNIDPDIEDKSVYRISEFLDFVEQLEAQNRLLVRELDNGNPILIGDLESTEMSEGMDYFKQLIDDLDVIESHTGVSFTMSADFDDEDDLDIVIARDLLTKGESICPFTITAGIMEGKEEDVLKVHEDEDFSKVTVEWKEYEMNILGQEISLGPVRFNYPNPELVNADEIRRKIGQSDPVDLELRPSDEATIQALTQD